MGKNVSAICDICMYYSYDEEYDCYTCEVDDQMDEDDVWRFMNSGRKVCPFFRMGDEYKIVHKQI